MKRADRQPTALPESYRAAALVPAIHSSEPESEQSAVPLSHYASILRRQRWKIGLFVVAAMAATFVVSSRITPIYEATTTVDIDRQTPPGVVGQEATRTSANNDTEQFLATQIKLVQSDSVVRPVAQKYNLLERENQRTPRNSARIEDAPVVLKKLKVTRPANTYLLLISYRSDDAKLASDVANGIAQSYLAHSYNIRFRAAASMTTFMEKQIEELRAKMERSSAALMKFERDLNVISPEEKTNILAARLLQLNTEFTTAQGDRVKKEAASQSLRNGSLEAAQASQLGEPLRKLTERLNETQQKFSDVSMHYGANHPEYKKAAGQLAELQKLHETTRQNIAERAEIEYREALNRETLLKNSVQEAKTEFDNLNARSFEYQAVKREAEADKKLYEELVRKIREAGINANFQNSSIRIADEARPAIKAVFPRLDLNLILAFLFSLLLAVSVAIIGDTLDNTIRDPEQVARTLNTEVLGSLPVVKKWKARLGPASENGDGAALMALSEAIGSSSSNYGEAIRTVRNSILLSDFDPRLRSLLVTSASPGEGKSTIAAHLAATHAFQGHRTLLIDGDLRRPSIHRRFGISTATGLSSVLLREKGWRQALVNVDGLADLDVLPAGPPLRRASDLIGRGLVEIFEEAVLDYDLVIVDGPPMLGFAEPLQMATIVDGVVVVARAGETNRKAVAAVLNTLSRLRSNVVGLVLNQVHHEMSDSYDYYKSYGKYYDSSVKA